MGVERPEALGISGASGQGSPGFENQLVSRLKLAESQVATAREELGTSLGS